MNFNFEKDWIVLVVIAIFISFVAYVIISGRKGEDKDKHE